MIIAIIISGIIILTLIGIIIYGSISVSNPRLKRCEYGQGEKILRILFFSDLHLGRLLRKKTASKILRNMKADADVIIFGGDLAGSRIERCYTKEDISRLFSCFSHIKYRFFVLGNHEIKIDHSWIEAAGFTILANDVATIKVNGKEVKIQGLDELHRGQPSLKEADIHIVHQPDYFQNIDSGLTLSGHSHGGQITLFGIRLYRARYSHAYKSGIYRRNNAQLVVSNGIGTNLIPLRIGARSDYWLIDYHF